ncbi:MAG: DNA topoisomerase (ATP-hydrolyzing) subunit A, partial [Microbacterium sp.]|uniref:DNA gyrase/topoisomerase IV subunit A n=1 Tax=Microbacterium sp. TaxID=51671 RepID=UPI003A8B14D1
MPERPSPQPIHERIEDVDVSAEMQGSYLEYAYSVIYSRALPDARDGLKPVQRRILYQMAEMGLRPDRGHVKSARVVGEVMGKLHPHGDAAIYDALVRLAQPFSLRVPLVDGHGNFGSLDDGPAASRYTEARLAPPALALTEHLDEDVVDFIPNYDGQFQQPEVLPAAFPNLLVNGTSGIAVGMATNMAPHNLIEVVSAAVHLLAHPEATLEELMEFVPGPDLPGGGVIVGLDGIKDAYATGRGTFRTRAKTSVEQIGPRRTAIVVTELPYLVGPERVIEKIKDAVGAKKLTGISDVTDLTDRKNGLRLVIGIKTGFDPQAVLQQLYRLTPLEDSFGINNNALVDGQPQTLGLKQLLRVYLDHRLRVVTRRSEYRLARKRERVHLVEGLLIAILDIDEVIQVIRTSDDGEQARARLQSVFDLSERQSEYILELRLRRLTKFSRLELEAERDALHAEIAALVELLGDPSLLRLEVAGELEAAADAYGTPRRTLLLDGGPVAARPARGAAPDLQIADAPCRVILSATGRMVRVPLDEDGGGIVPPARRAKHDAVRSSVETTTRGDLGAVTSTGRLVRFSPVDLPAVPGNSVQLSAGTPVDQYLGLAPGEHVVALVPLAGDPPLALGTAQGIVKRVAAAELGAKHDVEIIALKPGDRVVGADVAPDGGELVFVTSNAQLLRFDTAAVRPQGRSAAGMGGIRVADGERVVFFGVVPPAEDDTVVVTIAGSSLALAGADAGSAKVTTLAEFPAKGRATAGVRAQRLLKGEDTLTLAWVGT